MCLQTYVKYGTIINVTTLYALGQYQFIGTVGDYYLTQVQ